MTATQAIGPFDALVHDDGLWQLFARGEEIATAAGWAEDRACALRAARAMAAQLAPVEPEATKQLGLFGDGAR